MFERECSLEQLTVLIKELIAKLGDSGIILLRGDLASGKTTFVQYFVASLGLRAKVSSPTFSILNEYEKRVFHYDIYQDGYEGFMQSGLFEYLEKDGYHLIEWGDKRFEKLLKKLQIDYTIVEILPFKEKRKYKVSQICTH